jgi:hypothetical protein
MEGEDTRNKVGTCPAANCPTGSVTEPSAIETCNMQVSGCCSDQNMFQRLRRGCRVLVRSRGAQRCTKNGHMACAAPGPDPNTR